MMIKLRRGQDEVAAYRDGYMAVPAVPGAGKTTVLAYLTSELIARGFAGGDKILIVTFMNSAVANFRRKIGNFLVSRGFPRSRGYEVRTLHSLALNILKEKPEGVMINEEFNIIDGAEKGRMLRRIIDEWFLDNRDLFLRYFDLGARPGSRGYERALELWKEEHFPRFISSVISRFKIRGLDREQIRELQSRARGDSYLSWALSIYRRYSRLLQEQGYLDFDDLINRAYNLLEGDEGLCERLRKKYAYVFEDEAQDSNLLQEKILLKLAGREGNLVRVGDSNQAIMNTFTASDPEIFRSFTAKKKVKKHSILVSSRSSEDIMELANYLVKWTVESHPQSECRDALEEKYIHPVDGDDPFPNPETGGYMIAANIFSSSEKEVERVANLAARHVRENPDSTAAVLLPANYQIELVAEKLEELDADYESVRTRREEQMQIIEDFRLLLTYLAAPHGRGGLEEVLKFLLCGEKEYELELVEELLGRYLSSSGPEELLYPGDKERPEPAGDGGFLQDLEEDFLGVLDRLSFWTEAAVHLPPDELVLFLAEELQLAEEKLAVVQNMALEIRRELQRHPGWSLSRIAEIYPEMEESFRSFARRIYDHKGYEPQPGRVTLTTMHGAKGLEWDTVYLTFLTDSYFPSTLSSNFKGEYYYLEDEHSNPLAAALARLDYLLEGEEVDNPRQRANLDVIEEKLRLLYVGITRARKNLLLTCSKKTIFEDGYTRDEKPSRAFMALKKFIEQKRDNSAE